MRIVYLICVLILKGSKIINFSSFIVVSQFCSQFTKVLNVNLTVKILILAIPQKTTRRSWPGVDF